MTDATPAPSKAALPYLEHYPEPGQPPHRILIEQLPFRIGRSMSAQYIIYSRQVSKEHTEIYRSGGEYRIRDLGSTNGTFVNGQRVEEAPLVNGDIIHVAHKELRFGCESLTQDPESTPCTTEPAVSKLPPSVIRGTQHLRELLNDQRARIVFQPIVELETGLVVGYETLGRGTHRELSPNPADLFGLAHHANLAADLSRMFRSLAIEEASYLPHTARVFFNLHPAEVLDDSLIASLAEWKKSLPDGRQVVLEVHEGVVTDIPTMRHLRDELKKLDIGLAYDDFGAGRARLTELTEVPPDYIKLDRGLVQGIDGAAARQELVQALNKVITDLGVLCIAEGIETSEEAQVCRRLGCRLGQGYLFGRPQPLALLRVNNASGLIHAGAP
jgi:EAL domain-containing protein (putative c-di-GMP-specific phosphodiesterase class I)